MPRLFTALPLPANVAERLSMLRGGLLGARFVEPADYHVTLRFIDDVGERMADEIAHLLDGVRRRPLKIRLEGLDYFGGEKPRSLHALVAPTPELTALANEHETLMRRLGLPSERRKFVPHVTIARLKDTSPRAVFDWIALRSPFSVPAFEATRFGLYSSAASMGGGPYLEEAGYALRA
jgi:2'-5' RNA ligase